MESYVVRIYRRIDNDPRHMVGIIEIVQDGRQQRFSNLQELWEILTARDTKGAKPVRTRKPEDR